MIKVLEQFDTMTDAQLSAVAGGGKGVCRYVYGAANGYACRYSNGEWGYVVTKTNSQAALDTIVKGWAERGPWIPRGYQ